MSTELVNNSNYLLAALCKQIVRYIDNAEVSTRNDSNSLLGAIIDAKSVLQTSEANLCTCAKQIQIFPTQSKSSNNLLVNCLQLTTSYRLQAHTCNEHTSMCNTLLNLQIYGNQHTSMVLTTEHDYSFKTVSWIMHHHWIVCASFECLSAIPSATDKAWHIIFTSCTSKHNVLIVLLENMNSTSFQDHDQLLLHLLIKEFVLMLAYENLNPEKLNSCTIPGKEYWPACLSHSKAAIGAILIFAQKQIRKLLKNCSQ
eukprot:16032_1